MTFPGDMDCWQRSPLELQVPFASIRGWDADTISQDHAVIFGHQANRENASLEGTSSFAHDRIWIVISVHLNKRIDGLFVSDATLELKSKTEISDILGEGHTRGLTGTES